MPTTVTIDTAEVVNVLQEFQTAHAAADALKDEALKTKYDGLIDRAKGVRDDAVARADGVLNAALDQIDKARQVDVDAETHTRTVRDLRLAGAVQAIQTGTPVAITLPDAPAAVPTPAAS